VAAVATQDGNKDISKDHPGTPLGMAVSVMNYSSRTQSGAGGSFSFFMPRAKITHPKDKYW